MRACTSQNTFDFSELTTRLNSYYAIATRLKTTVDVNFWRLSNFAS